MLLDNLSNAVNITEHLLQAFHKQLIVIQENTPTPYGIWLATGPDCTFEFNSQAHKRLFTFYINSQTNLLTIRIPPSITLHIIDDQAIRTRQFCIAEASRLQHIAPLKTSLDQFELAQNAHLAHLTYGLNPPDSESQAVVKLAGEAAHVDWRSYFIGDHSDVSSNIRIEHQQPHTYSNCCVKTVLFHKAQFTFNGDITISTRAKHAFSKQNNFNYLFSAQAHAISNPNLNIHNKHVRATHGSATQMIHASNLFYLQSRGLTSTQAQQLLIHGFLKETYAHLPIVEPVMDALFFPKNG